jgi:hypothetical protein
MSKALTPDQERRLAELVAVYPVADELGRRFADAGHELYLVGGTVRDTLLHGPTEHDLDFATSALPEDTERVLDGWVDDLWLTGARFGTVSAKKGGWKLEITTFRSDSTRRTRVIPRSPSATHRGRPRPPRLHRERHGRPGARLPLRRPVRRPRRTCGPSSCARRSIPR